jgi:hypothetical protein
VGESGFGQLIGSVLCGTLVARASGEVVPRTTVGSIYGVHTNQTIHVLLIESELVGVVGTMTENDGDEMSSACVSARGLSATISASTRGSHRGFLSALDEPLGGLNG